MNRETKRNAASGPSWPRRHARDPSRPCCASPRKPAKKRTTIREFFRQVREEMRQVSWPTRAELINYTAITLFVLITMIVLIYGLNLAYGKFVLFLFKK